MTFKFIDPDWALTRAELDFLQKYRGKNKFRGALFLKHYQRNASFPACSDDLVFSAIRSVTEQLECNDSIHDLDFQDRTAKRQRVDIREYFGFRLPSSDDYEHLQDWLHAEVIEEPEQNESLREGITQWCLKCKIEKPSEQKQERIIRGALAAFEADIFRRLEARLSNDSRLAVDMLFAEDHKTGADDTAFSTLKTDPGRPGLQSVMNELLKLESIDRLALPDNLFEGINDKTVSKYRRRAAVETAWEMRRHPDGIRYTLACAFLLQRRGEIIDGLIELLIQLIHKIKIRSEKRVTKEIAGNVREVSNKKMILFKLAQAALDNPEGSVRDVLFPAVGKNVLEDLVKEFQAERPIYKEKLQVYIRNSYKNHYRQMVPPILQALRFRCNNAHHRPVIEALDYILQAKKSQRKIPARDVPIKGIIPKSLQPFLIMYDEKNCDDYIDRISYEICVLQALRDGLRCREIWVEGAYKFRNPDDDVPHDFESKRNTYYKSLNLPLKTHDFIGELKGRMSDALDRLNRNIPRNPKVSIRPHGKNLIHLSPLEPQPEPQFLNKLKAEVAGRWPLTGLLDIVKEADLHTGFTECFKSSGDRQILDQNILQPRLLLTLYALGTNTGLKRVLAGDGRAFTFDELRHVRERYIHKDALREAIAKVVNATLKIRQSQIWGEGTTSCASDSKKLHAWDQNLMSEWHVRYKGPGIMIYWHVEKKSLCIHSQIKRCSSSEVSTVIEGMLHHCTDMEIDTQYVDSHGQSEVAFAFCELLGFSLMPRLKAIASQKLYLPEAGVLGQYGNLTPILNQRPINWDLISNQYDQMVKYASALQKGTASAESILNRFTRNNRQHPTYQALAELGRAVKTVFLCEYLASEELRREIHEALNVVENCNSTVEFIFFARNSELTSNQLANQEISILALHLLQVCLVYVNTMMIQDVLKEEKWMDSMQTEDLRALTPLIYQHVTPYGSFDLDMSKRIFDPANDTKIAA